MGLLKDIIIKINIKQFDIDGGGADGVSYNFCAVQMVALNPEIGTGTGLPTFKWDAGFT